MKKIFLSQNLFMIGLILFCHSCSDDFSASQIVEEDLGQKKIETVSDETSINGPKGLVTYQITGDFSGKLDITFLSSDDFTPPQPSMGFKIPWETSYDVPLNNNMAIGGYANGLYGDAIVGEKALLKMSFNDHLIETVIRKADENGMITLPLEIYGLEQFNPEVGVSETNIGKEVVYSIEGDFSGKIMVVYQVADGSRENIEVTDLPWNYSFTTTEHSLKASIYGIGSEGQKGEEIEFNISVDGSIFKSELVNTDNNHQIGLFPELIVPFN